jgi:hypothetical protein
MSESMALVGLDVHRVQTVAAVLDPVSGELRVERVARRAGACGARVPGAARASGARGKELPLLPRDHFRVVALARTPSPASAPFA